MSGRLWNRRIIVTHDVNTIPKYAYDRVRAAQPMPGVIVIPEDLAIGAAIEELTNLEAKVIKVFGEKAANKEVVPQIENLIGALEKQ